MEKHSDTADSASESMTNTTGSQHGKGERAEVWKALGRAGVLEKLEL